MTKENPPWFDAMSRIVNPMYANCTLGNYEIINNATGTKGTALDTRTGGEKRAERKHVFGVRVGDRKLEGRGTRAGLLAEKTD